MQNRSAVHSAQSAIRWFLESVCCRFQLLPVRQTHKIAAVRAAVRQPNLVLIMQEWVPADWRCVIKGLKIPPPSISLSYLIISAAEK